MRRLVLVVLILSGCAGPAEQEDPVAAAPEPEVDVGNVTLDLPAQTNGTVGGIALTAQGGAGSWFVAFHPLPNGTQEVSAEYSFRAETTGPAGAVFWAQPTLVWGQPDAWQLRFSPFQRATLVEPGGSYSAASAGGVGASGSGLAGVFAAFAADAPWRVTFEFAWGDGQVASPAFLQAGDGAVFGFGAQHTVPAANGAAAGISSYEVDVGAGWNHIEVLSTRLQPDEVRQYSFRLPGGHSASGTSTMRGHDIPMVGGSASSSARVDYVGALDDGAGTASAEITYVAASTEVRFGHMHIPLQVLPPGLAPAQYQGSTWPFGEAIPLPYQTSSSSGSG